MQDICAICGKTGKYGTMESVNDIDFAILCGKCKGKRCFSCNFLRSSMKLGSKRYFCKHRGVISNPKANVCDHWQKQSKNYSMSATVKDYQNNA